MHVLLFFFFFFVWHVLVSAKLKVRLLIIYCSWTVVILFDFSTYFQSHQWVPCTNILLSFFFWHAFNSAKLKVRLLFMHYSWTVATLFDFLTYFQPHQWVPCTVHRTYKLHFSTTFFIKNGSYGTIHTFKIYFVTVFSVFNF